MKTILLADDEENLRLLVHTTIEDSGYTILEAENGTQALELTRTHRPALIVLDWMMPGMTGIEVTRAVRQQPETAEIPIILLTARSQAEDRALARAAGANAYLAKPFSPMELFETIESLLGAV